MDKGWMFVDPEDEEQIEAVGGANRLRHLATVANASVRPRNASMWEWAEVMRDLIRNDEVQLMYDRVKELQNWEGEFYGPDDEIVENGKYVWLRAIDEVLLVLDERMEHLWRRHG